MRKYRVLFLGAGEIASAHAFALGALRHYYPDAPSVTLAAVASATPESRERFARRHGFTAALPTDAVWELTDIDAVYALGPNEVHCPHLRQAVRMRSASHVFVEKPVCVTLAEEEEVRAIASGLRAGQRVQTGYSFLQMAPAREALMAVRGQEFGDPIHFAARYLHSGYLDQGYRDRRRGRLQSAPLGGVTADLGSHLFSFLVASLGPEIEVVAAEQSGRFPDVSPESDLCLTALLRHAPSGAVGTVQASRISAGAGELLELDLRFTRGALRFSTDRPDVLETYSTTQRGWRVVHCGSDFTPTSAFPSPHASAGWLRALVHANYLFLTGNDAAACVPDLDHALVVQRLIRDTVGRLAKTRAGCRPIQQCPHDS